jgi:hypothetical protein
VPAALQSLPDVAAALINEGCDRQLDVLIATTKAVEP